MSKPGPRVGQRPSEQKQDESEIDKWLDTDVQDDERAEDHEEGRGGEQAAATGLMKRLTLDLPEELHTLIKVSCARRRTKMQPEIRALLWEKYGDTETH